MNKIIRQIKSSILLQLTGIVFLIIIVLITTMVMLQNYIGAMERKNAETLCESLMEQSSDALGLYQEKLRYQASLFCRLPMETFLKEETREENPEETPEEDRGGQGAGQIALTETEREEILIALVLGGMPISGGAKVRFENIIVGALLYIVLNNGLTMMGMTTQAMQLIQGVVFLIFVAVFADRQSLQVIK